MKPIRLSDPGREYRLLKAEIELAVMRVLASGNYVLDETVSQFEAAFAAYCGVRHGIATASGTMALIVGLRAAGIGPGDEVITAPYTCQCTSAAITLAGAGVRFADIDEATLTLDPDCVAGAITPYTRGVIPVHLHGLLADMDPLRALASRHGLLLLEDAALAAGGQYRGRRAGSLGDAAAFSFAPSKVLGGIGWGGMLVTDDETLAQQARQIAGFGYRPEPGSPGADREGYNAMMSSVQAAALGAKLPFLEGWLARRRVIAARLDAACDRLGLVRLHPPETTLPSWRTYVVRHPRRDRIIQELGALGVEAASHFTPVLHTRPLYRPLGYHAGDFPVAERVTGDLLCLPLHPHLTDDEVASMVDALTYVLARIETGESAGS